MLRLITILAALILTFPAYAHDPAKDDSGQGFITTEAASFDTVSVLANDDGTLAVDSIDHSNTTGTVSCQANGICNYDPAGQFDHLNDGDTATDSFEYTVIDGAPDTAMVTITITGVSPPPSGNLLADMVNACPGGFCPITGTQIAPFLNYEATLATEFGATEAAARCAPPDMACQNADDNVNIWSGAAWHDDGIIVGFGGGHASTQVNASFQFMSETLTWRTVNWHSPILPAGPPGDSYHLDTDGDGVYDDCRLPAEGILAGHTVDGAQAIPGTDWAIWYTGFAQCWKDDISQSELTAGPGIYLFNVNTLERHRLPVAQFYADWSSTAFLNDKVYIRGKNHIGVFEAQDLDGNGSPDWGDPNAWVELQRANQWIGKTGGHMIVGPLNGGHALFIQSNYDITTYPLDANGLVDWQNNPMFVLPGTTWPSGWGTSMAGAGLDVWGDYLIGYLPPHRIYVVDPQTGVTRLPQKCSGADVDGGDGQVDLAHTFSKWGSVHNGAAFMAVVSTVSGAGGEVLLYKPDPNMVLDGSDNWVTDKFFCEGAPTPVNPNQPPEEPGEPVEPVEEGAWPKPDMSKAKVLVADTVDQPTYFNPDEGIEMPSRCLSAVDATANEHCKAKSTQWGSKGVKRTLEPYASEEPDPKGPQVVTEPDGNKALQFDIVTHGDSGSYGSYRINFSDLMERPFLPGDRFSVRYRVKVSCTMIYQNQCDEHGEPLPGARRVGYMATNGGWTWSKFSIIAGSNKPGEHPARDCDLLQIVVNGGIDQKLVLYVVCGRYAGAEAHVTEPYKTVNTQPGGDIFCPSHTPHPAKYRGWNEQADSCFFVEPNKYFTLEFDVLVGPWQPEWKGERKTRIRVTAQYEGEPKVTVFDHPFYITGSADPDYGYGHLTLLPFMTGKDIHDDHIEGWMRFDDWMVCREFCPDELPVN